MANREIEESQKHLMYAASYMDNEIVSKSGRNRKGENDFAALRCIIALNTVYDKLTPEIIARMKKFLLEEDIASEYGSENHVFVFRVCRFLTAEFFGEDFPYYKMTCQEVLKQKKKYILDPNGIIKSSSLEKNVIYLKKCRDNTEIKKPPLSAFSMAME